MDPLAPTSARLSFHQRRHLSRCRFRSGPSQLQRNSGSEAAITVDYIGPSRTNGYSITGKRAVILPIPLGNRIEHHRALGTDLFAPYFLTLLGDVTLRADQFTKCIAALDEAERVLIRTGKRWWESETHRLRGALLVAQGGAEAQASFEKALAVARRSDAKSSELRAAVSLAQTLAAAGKVV